MAKIPTRKRRRWRGVALGGPLQRGARFCFSAHDGLAWTAQLSEWLSAGHARPLRWQIRENARALRSIGAIKIRRVGRSEWLWQLKD
jgi:hypothetical protein